MPLFNSVKLSILGLILVVLISMTTMSAFAQNVGATSGPYNLPSQKNEGRSGSADVQVIVFPAVMFRNLPAPDNLEDHLTFTYNRVVSMQTVQRDLIAYNKLTNKPLHMVTVTTGKTPLTAARSDRMTSVTFMAADVIQPRSGHFDIDPFIEALKPYRKQRIAFVAPVGFQFTGLRSYKDDYLTINVSTGGDERGAMYTYDVDVNNPSFTGLHLPTWQADPRSTQVATAQSNDRVRLIKILGIVLVGSIAAFVGYVVYSVMIVRPPAN